MALPAKQRPECYVIVPASTRQCDAHASAVPSFIIHSAELIRKLPRALN